MDREKLKQAAALILEAVGQDGRDGTKETPERFAKMMEERLAYAGVSNEEIAREFDKVFPCDDGNMVVVKDIDVFSFCEHHIALMYDMRIAIGYIPKGCVIGLSKLARIADAVCRRLQLQERIGADIYDVLRRIVKTDDIIVCIQGEHSCMTARGIKKPGSQTRTLYAGGVFDDPLRRNEFFNLIR